MNQLVTTLSARPKEDPVDVAMNWANIDLPKLMALDKQVNYDVGHPVTDWSTGRCITDENRINFYKYYTPFDQYLKKRIQHLLMDGFDPNKFTVHGWDVEITVRALISEIPQTEKELIYPDLGRVQKTRADRKTQPFELEES